MESLEFTLEANRGHFTQASESLRGGESVPVGLAAMKSLRSYGRMSCLRDCSHVILITSCRKVSINMCAEGSQGNNFRLNLSYLSQYHSSSISPIPHSALPRRSVFRAPGPALWPASGLAALSVLVSRSKLGSQHGTPGGQQVRLVPRPAAATGRRGVAPSGPGNGQDSERSHHAGSERRRRRSELGKPRLRTEVPLGPQRERKRLELCDGQQDQHAKGWCMCQLSAFQI